MAVLLRRRSGRRHVFRSITKSMPIAPARAASSAAVWFVCCGESQICRPSRKKSRTLIRCAGQLLRGFCFVNKMLHFKRAKSTFAALCNVEKRQAVWYNREHADNTRLDFRRASPQSKRMDFNIMNKNSFRYKNKRRTGRLRSFLSPALAALMVFSSLAACTLTACKKMIPRMSLLIFCP